MTYLAFIGLFLGMNAHVGGQFVLGVERLQFPRTILPEARPFLAAFLRRVDVRFGDVLHQTALTVELLVTVDPETHVAARVRPDAVGAVVPDGAVGRLRARIAAGSHRGYGGRQRGLLMLQLRRRRSWTKADVSSLDEDWGVILDGRIGLDEIKERIIRLHGRDHRVD